MVTMLGHLTTMCVYVCLRIRLRTSFGCISLMKARVSVTKWETPMKSDLVAGCQDVLEQMLQLRSHTNRTDERLSTETEDGIKNVGIQQHG